jgi:Fe-S cluster biogenesis protein NfuA
MTKKKGIHERVETVLNELIRPSLRADGGDIQVEDVNEEKGIVKLRLTGCCTGCPMSGNTFYNMVEKTLKEKIPEITSVRQVSWGQYLEV